MAYYLDTDVTYLKGVGPKWGDKLHRLGFRTLKDLVSYYPRTYEDRRHQRKINTLKKGERVYICGEIVNLQKMFRGPGQRIHIMTIKDDTGFLFCRFYRVPYRTYFEKFHVGQKVLAFGIINDFKGRKEIAHPELTLLSEFKEDSFMGLLPIYSEDEELSSKKIHKWILSALTFLEENPDKVNFAEEFEFLPDWVLKKNNLINRYQALKEIHNPDINQVDDYFKYNSAAQKRFIFDEFFQLELYLIFQKMKLKQQEGIKLNSTSILTSKLLQKFPYQLTHDQKNSFQEILKDFASGFPMNRLLQGDVGSGKTAVIFLSMLSAIECGAQAVLMAPTEVLAEQHYQGALKLLSDLGFEIGFLSSKVKSKDKIPILEKIASGKIQFIIGTHALIEESVQFSKLGLVVVDEQHRFGVEQRQKLKSKSQIPHFLMVTATPIPRTLAMTTYGDLDISFLHEKPPGRSPIQTKIVMENQREQLYKFMFEQVQKGRQAFMIFPLVEESEKLPLKDVSQGYKDFSTKYPTIKWGLLHGKMSSDDKQKIMDEFRKNKIQILLSTTVI